MDSGEERWDRVVGLFAVASGLSGEERAEWVRTECGPDHSLAAEVLSLLGAVVAEHAATSRAVALPVDEVATEADMGRGRRCAYWGRGAWGRCCWYAAPTGSSSRKQPSS